MVGASSRIPDRSSSSCGESSCINSVYQTAVIKASWPESQPFLLFFDVVVLASGLSHPPRFRFPWEPTPYSQTVANQEGRIRKPARRLVRNDGRATILHLVNLKQTMRARVVSSGQLVISNRQ